ncbi:MAG TPA: hypothetical protein VEF34_15130 [Syntrophobacteraceae bacterium]|nr:hypothetical protein [Syntrophobacteraceae bacterium]
MKGVNNPKIITDLNGVDHPECITSMLNRDFEHAAVNALDKGLALSDLSPSAAIVRALSM